MKKLIALLLGFALLAAACGDDTSEDAEPAETAEVATEPVDEPADDPEPVDEPLVIGISNLGLGFPFTASIGDGIIAKAEELGFEVIQLDAEFDLNKQLNDVQDLLAQGIDGLFLIPLDGAAAESIVDDVVAAGVPIMSVAVQVGDPLTREIDDVYPGLAALITQDEKLAGDVMGDIALTLFPDGGKAAIVEGAAGFPENTTRTVLFREKLEAAGFEIVASQPGGWVSDVAEAACQNMLQADPDIDVFYALNDDMALGCAEAVEAAGSDAQILGIGASATGIEAVANGTTAGTLCHQPFTMGDIAMTAMAELLSGETAFDGDFLTYDTPGVTADNLDSCVPQW